MAESHLDTSVQRSRLFPCQSGVGTPPFQFLPVFYSTGIAGIGLSRSCLADGCSGLLELRRRRHRQRNGGELPCPPSQCVNLGSMRTSLSLGRSQYVKAGYASDNLPRFTFPSIVGRPILRAEEEAIGDVELKVSPTYQAGAS